ncbi:MAG: hypothetical protein KAI67_03740 [Candidatus Pacebacteria bacterium]|nr:hypothetical protein [Candidatus Paceibacterota bacterium]
MDNAKNDFDYRKIEVEDYFSFLKIINDDATLIKYVNGAEIVEKKISNKLQTMFIANAFLILYNLIESTVKNSIVEIYNKIKEDKNSYENLSENLQKIWINQKIDNLKEGTYNHDTLLKTIQNIAKNVLAKETIALSKDDINISGNIDAKKIRELAENIGFEKSSNGRNLQNIKDKRNRLAHGEQTFYDVGKNFTFKELNGFKQETFDYLTDVIEKIEKFIVDQEYVAN